MRAARVDDNQGEIVRALEKIGAVVVSLASLGDGCPDLLVGFRGKNFLLEIKNPKGRGARLTPDQEVFHSTWVGQVAIVYTVAGALGAIEAIWKENGEK